MRVAPKATKGKKHKTWKKGESSASNPVIRKHRDKVKRTSCHNVLTTTAIETHNQINFGNLRLTDRDDDDERMSIGNSVKTFATVFSNCTNANFEDFLSNWSAQDPLQKEMLAVLTSVTESIKEKEGSQTTTEFYACLMTTLEEAKDLNVMAATVELLRIISGHVPLPVYKHGFDRFVEIFLNSLVKTKDSLNSRLLRGLIYSLGCVCKSLTGSGWRTETNPGILECLIVFGQHPEADVRKSVRRVLVAILTLNHSDESKTLATMITSLVISKMNETSVKDTNYINTVVCLMSMLRCVVSEVSSQTLKKICESVLSCMTLGNVKISCAALDVLDGIFVKRNTCGLTAQMSNQVFNALFEFTPSAADTDLVIKWLSTTLNLMVFWSQHHVNYFTAGVVQVSKTFVSMLTSGENNVQTRVVKSLTTLLDSTAKLSLDLEVITKVSTAVDSSLDLRYSHAWSSSLVIVSHKFSTFGSNFPLVCLETVKMLAGLRQSHQFELYEELDITIGHAVQVMGPKSVCQVIGLDLDIEKGKIETAWILPVLRHSIDSCELSFFHNFFVPFSAKIRKLSAQIMDTDSVSAKHLSIVDQQIWSLLPKFMSGATDIVESFPKMAPVLGKALKEEEPVMRTHILSGLRVICKRTASSLDPKEIETVGKFSKNFLPILLNLYSFEDEQLTKELRLSVFETIDSYLRVSEPSKAVELYHKTVERYDVTHPRDLFLQIAYLDLMRVYIPFLDEQSIQHLYNEVAKPLFKSSNSRLCKKSFRIVEELCKTSNPSGKKFITENLEDILTHVIDAIECSPSSVVASPLNGVRHLLSQFFVMVPDQMEGVANKMIPLVFKCLMNNTKRTRMASVELMRTITTAAFVTGNGVALIKNHLRQFLTHEDYGDKALMVITCLFDLLTTKVTEVELRQLLNLIYTPRNTRAMVRGVVSFTSVLLKSKTADDLLPILPSTMAWMSELNPKLKKLCRIHIRDLLTKLVRKFGFEVVSKMLPEDLAKVMKNVRKKELHKKKKHDDDGDMET